MNLSLKTNFFVAIMVFAILLTYILVPSGAVMAEDAYLSDMTPVSEFAHPGVNDGKIKNDAECSLGGRITIAGVSYDKGISMHPDAKEAYAIYDISGMGYQSFYAVIGKDDVNTVGDKEVIFQVFADNALKYEKRMINGPGEKIFVDITNAKELKLAVLPGADTEAYDSSDFADAQLSALSVESLKEAFSSEVPSPNEKKAHDYISDMTWSAFNGYTDATIPEKVYKNTDIFGEPIYYQGDTFSKGFSYHAGLGNRSSYVEVNINGLGYVEFGAVIGSPDLLTSVHGTSFEFVVLGDGEELYRSETITEAIAGYAIQVDITDVKMLTLAVDSLDDISGDVAVWAGAVVSTQNDTEKLVYAAVEGYTPAPEKTAGTPSGNGETTSPSAAATAPQITDSRTAAATAPADDAQSDGSTPIWTWIVLAAALVAAGIAAVFIFKRKRTKSS